MISHQLFTGLHFLFCRLGEDKYRPSLISTPLTYYYIYCCKCTTMHTEYKMKCNTKFEIELQNNLWVYSYIVFTTWKSKQSLIILCLIITVIRKQAVKIPYPKQNPMTIRYLKSLCVCVNLVKRYWLTAFPLS